MTTIVAEYLWIDAFDNIRSKSRTISVTHNLKIIAPNLKDFPEWNFDGSSTGQAEGNNSEVIIKPVSFYIDPMRKFKEVLCYLVLCDCYDNTDKPLISNNRHVANLIFTKVASSIPWFGLEQEYTLYDGATGKILGWPSEGLPEKQGKYYCGVGADRIFGRNIIEEHYEACITAGLNISGINAEVLPGQWEFQIGPCEGIKSGDQMYVARYLLHKISEKYNVIASFNPKPVPEWNGSGLHTNYSTKEMRESNGIEHIMKAIEKLSKKHDQHIKVYGDNNNRLTGKHETSNINKFTYGVADRTGSVRIPTEVAKNKCGYFEDRRPASNACPYKITSIITETTLL